MLLKAKVFPAIVAGQIRPAATPAQSRSVGLLRNKPDKWLIGASFIYVVLVIRFPNIWTVGLGVWWLLNTVAHNFIHQPFFRSRELNKVFAFYLSAISGVPQQLWRERHIAHHANKRWQWILSSELLIQAVAVALIWICLFHFAFAVALGAVVPGFLLAMLLCAMQGHFEHVGGTVSNYGRFYNWLFFNDGFHHEHHHRPGAHWSALPELRRPKRTSRWPAVIRWLDYFNLNALERAVCRIRPLQAFTIRVHERAVRKLTGHILAPDRVTIIGGGLFPRTALVVHLLWPKAKVTIIDSNEEHLRSCQRWLRGDEVLEHAHISTACLPQADLLFVPLAFDASKKPLYLILSHPDKIIIHDWLWNRGRRSVVVSWLLFKRLNLVG